MQVIIPVYKVEKYIEECVNSVLSQNSKYHVLLTIVNDGSPDRSREILRNYEHLPHVEIIDQENRGLSGARNAGLEVIKGKYVTFLDSDDMLMPGSIDAMMDKAFATDADIVEGSYVTFVRKDEEINIVRHQPTVGDRWLGVLFGYPWGKVYRASLFEKLRFPEGYWFEDTLCSFLVYPQCKKIITLTNLVYRYRLNPKGITATAGGNPKCLDTLLITIQLLKEAKVLGLKADDQLYDMFLIQVRNNASRIFSLRNTELDKLVFRISCLLKQEYFPMNRTKSKRLVLIEQALLNQDYLHYLLAVM